VLHALSISSSLTYCVWKTHELFRYYNLCIKMYTMLQHVSAFYGCHWVKYFHLFSNLLLFSLKLAKCLQLEGTQLRTAMCGKSSWSMFHSYIRL
jgi:hypothetical protein